MPGGPIYQLKQRFVGKVDFSVAYFIDALLHSPYNSEPRDGHFYAQGPFTCPSETLRSSRTRFWIENILRIKDETALAYLVPHLPELIDRLGSKYVNRSSEILCTMSDLANMDVRRAVNVRVNIDHIFDLWSEGQRVDDMQYFYTPLADDVEQKHIRDGMQAVHFKDQKEEKSLVIALYGLMERYCQYQVIRDEFIKKFSKIAAAANNVNDLLEILYIEQRLFSFFTEGINILSYEATCMDYGSPLRGAL